MIAGAPSPAPTSAPSQGGGGLLGGIGSVLGAIGGPLVSGGLNLLGGLFQQQGQQSSIGSQEAFQQQMSSSAYSRAVADMKNAGLNPALMYGSGGPESSPSGGMATPPNVLGGVANSAMDAMKLQKDQEQQQAGIDLTKAQTINTLADSPTHKLGGDISAGFDAFAPVVLKLLKGIATSADQATPPSSSISSALSHVAPKTGSFGQELASGLNPFDPYFMSMKDRPGGSQ